MRIYADFNNRDPDGFIRLNTIGTIKSLAASGIVLREGLGLIVGDEDLEADVVVRTCGVEKIWRAEIIGEIREVDKKGEGGN